MSSEQSAKEDERTKKMKLLMNRELRSKKVPKLAPGQSFIAD
jgi:hypothetical protein